MIGVIFDLDGTLVDSYDLDEQLYRKAVLSELPNVKLRKSWYDYHYSTDSGILMEILTEFNLPVRDYYDSVRRRFGNLVKNHLQSANKCAPIRMKLEAAGLSDLNVPMSSGDDAHSRKGVMQICASKMKSSISSFVYVGDAEWDLRAANKLGWQFIGVGPRIEGKCDIWVPDLRNATPFLNLSHS
jgi:phosphoglycolate phosphatase-like HAD superfamily hydrolase